MSWNTTFKHPTGEPAYKTRSPSPPRAYVEPLSPIKPRPIEPNFNYPAVTQVNYEIQPQQVYAAKARPQSEHVAERRWHRRTPSTIDTLAEAALAVSPHYNTHSRKGSGNTSQYHNGYTNGQQHAAYGASEPPHKRAKSELLPSPQTGMYAARPATSYEAHGQVDYESKVEEAALLLNFRTNGNAMSLPQAPGAPTNRPHANSFPQDAFSSRSPELTMHRPLLPPFVPRKAAHHQHMLPSPRQTSSGNGACPHVSYQDTNAEEKEAMKQALRMAAFKGHEVEQGKPQQTHTPPDDTDSHADSVEIGSSETSEAMNGRRVGWPKGKPRGPKNRKTIAEKAAKKRAAAARKKMPNAKTAKKAAKRVADTQDVRDEMKPRRKSLSDVPTTIEQEAADTAARSHSVPQEVLMSIREASPSKAGPRHARVTSDTVCTGCQVSRENATSTSELDEWISCNGCKKWFHIDCAGFKKAHEVRDVDKYFCTSCEPKHGKTTFVRKSARAHASVDYAELQKGVLKMSEESMDHHYIQPIKDGTFQFEPEMFPRIRPEMVTREFLEKSGTFAEPICIPAEWNPRPWKDRAGKSADYDKAAAEGQAPEVAMADMMTGDFEYDTVRDDGQDKLDMVMPQGLTVRQVCNLVGPDMPLDVIDVKTQNSGAKWTLGRWADYYEEEGDEKAIRNVISLEVSQTKLGRLLRRPKVVRDIDLQDSVWPQEERAKGKWPKVQYYCLMSVKDSYTDFHIDFGGSSVYYHILKGKKTFFFIPPKPKHLKAYEEWNESPQQNYTFLPSITKECYRVNLNEGDTMLIPSGWIHAVWTPETSLVIGGNFLTRMSFKNQFKIVEIEKANHTPMKFRHPMFQRVMWYTAIQYLTEDPLPPETIQALNSGEKFVRQSPIWQDFDGSIAANDPRPGARNARYYGRAEMDGLHELSAYIFSTIMIVLGRVEGHSEDQKKRINASIPKGYGDPLEIAKTFALWVAWKHGTDPPAFAHPDLEGPAKKLSARALKELEKKEAAGTFRVVPDRQSERVLRKMAEKGNSALAANSGANGASNAPHDSIEQKPSIQHQHHQFQHHQQLPEVVSPASLMMNGVPGQYFSTPKTSVLGPKRVACDACRKRRIRCKHKDLVMQTTPDDVQHANGVSPIGAPTFQVNLAPELHDNITVSTSAQPNPYHVNGQYSQANGFHQNGTPTGDGPLPGTNAYINANIPMTMNGVPIFGEVQRLGRSKACFECRKSKRRCVHDDSGNVDPMKAAETPVPRGLATKKRLSGDGGSPATTKKKQDSPSEPVMPPHQGGIAGILVPSKAPSQAPLRPPGTQPPPRIVNHSRDEPRQQAQQPALDPSLFEPLQYPDPKLDGTYSSHNPYYAPAEPNRGHEYDFQSLERIANEALDMDGGEPQGDYIDQQLNALAFQRHKPRENIHVYHHPETASMPNGHASKIDESVDSAVSLPNYENMEQRNVVQHAELSIDDRLRKALGGGTENGMFHGTPAIQHSVNVDSNACPKANISDLPLWQPPAAVSQSPAQTTHQPADNGTDATLSKRRRESLSATPGTKKMKTEGQSDRATRELGPQGREDERMAKQMQQEELGLRQRKSRT